jgi:hypothetical protein
MAKFSDGFAGSASSRMDVPVCSDEFAARFPNITDVLVGRLSAESGKWERGPGSIIVFQEVDRLKFVLSPKFSSRIAFGTFTDGLGGFSDLEQAIELGHYEWKLRSGQKRS